MIQELQTTFTQIEQQKKNLLASIADWTPERLALQPGEDAWCATEVIDHLCKTEALILSVLPQGMEDPQPIDKRDRVNFHMLERLFRSEKQVKVPTTAHATLPAMNFLHQEVVQRWDRTRTELAQLLDAIQEDQLKGGIFRHPQTGWLSLPQVLTFFSVHMIHHTYQIKRLG
ncbi:DinB family protein [Terriglobus saanensis]|uniref:DinB-like domain-containing protein n=1 Tax=Terriglobus saanensis (strain ATCC BAA-1853 / DSM 23119 / SP1PR4) TaxID=401053 RepID=E8V235_TERSS|nr:DinB family protein [Terriglobus saanensis]ADV84592.1 hypothetical protein AciPR4_3843 [Terriglobus saanensis SP1PR4]